MILEQYEPRIPHRIRSAGAARAQVLPVVKGEPAAGDADE